MKTKKIVFILIIATMTFGCGLTTIKAQSSSSDIAKDFEENILPVLINLCTSIGSIIVGFVVLFRGFKKRMDMLKSANKECSIINNELLQEKIVTSQLSTRLLETKNDNEIIKKQNESIIKALQLMATNNINLVENGIATKICEELLVSEKEN